MIDFKDITDIIMAPLIAVVGWLFKSLNDRPTREEVQRMLDQNNSVNKVLLDELKDDIIELKEGSKDTRNDLKEIRELIIKCFRVK